MMMVPPDPVVAPRGAAVPLAGMSPRRRPDGEVGAAANWPDVVPPLEPELDVEPPLPPLAGAGAGADEAPVPVDGVLPAWCWASIAGGAASTPMRIAGARYRVISTVLEQLSCQRR